MSQQNVEIIRRSWETFVETGEIFWEVMDPDVEIRDFDLPDAAGVVRRKPWLLRG